jgi:hypothetical protein
LPHYWQLQPPQQPRKHNAQQQLRRAHNAAATRRQGAHIVSSTTRAVQNVQPLQKPVSPASYYRAKAASFATFTAANKNPEKMNISQRSRAAIMATATGHRAAEIGVTGSKFFALLKLIDIAGEPIQCEQDSKLHGLKALQISRGTWVACHRVIFKGGASKCTWFVLQNPAPNPAPKYKAGQVVHYTNPQGVYWGERTIIAAEFWQGDNYTDWRYYLSASDTPWYPVGEKCLYPAPHRFFTIGTKSGYIESAGSAASFYYLQSLFLVRKSQNLLSIIK